MLDSCPYVFKPHSTCRLGCRIMNDQKLGFYFIISPTKQIKYKQMKFLLFKVLPVYFIMFAFLVLHTNNIFHSIPPGSTIFRI